MTFKKGIQNRVSEQRQRAQANSDIRAKNQDAVLKITEASVSIHEQIGKLSVTREIRQELYEKLGDFTAIVKKGL